MAAMSHESVVMQRVFCALCARSNYIQNQCAWAFLVPCGKLSKKASTQRRRTHSHTFGSGQYKTPTADYGLRTTGWV